MEVRPYLVVPPASCPAIGGRGIPGRALCRSIVREHLSTDLHELAARPRAGLPPIGVPRGQASGSGDRLLRAGLPVEVPQSFFF